MRLANRRSAPVLHQERNPARNPSGLRPETYRSEEHTSELHSQSNLVCRLLLEKQYSASDITMPSKAPHTLSTFCPPSRNTPPTTLPAEAGPRSTNPRLHPPAPWATSTPSHRDH